jgi:hypothetical protein
MPHSRRLFEMLPLYAQLADEIGLLQHLCDVGVQPQLDILYKIVQLQEYLYDPDHPASFPHLDWLGQFVGLGKIEDHYLGIGINPEWSTIHKRNLIKSAWKYWRIKGTEKGIRMAIALWLLWDKSDDRQLLEIRQPLGRFPLEEPPNWITCGTRYNHFRTQTFNDLQRMGWGDAPGRTYRPRYKIFTDPGGSWVYGNRYSDRRLLYRKPNEISKECSMMGIYRPWMHFNELDETNWHKIFPDIFDLNHEIWMATSTPTVIGWFHFPVKALEPKVLPPKPIAHKYKFECDGIHYGDRYQPRIVKKQEIVRIQKRWTFWEKACWYGDAFGWTKPTTVIPPPRPPMALAFYGDIYGTVAKVSNESRRSRIHPAKFYYGDGVLTESAKIETLICSPGIWLQVSKKTAGERRFNEQILTIEVTTVETEIPAGNRLTNISALQGDRFFDLRQNFLQPYAATKIEEIKKIGSIIASGFWNSGAPWNYFVRKPGQGQSSAETTELIQLCHFTRRYSRRILTIVEKKTIPQRAIALHELFPMLKQASDSKNWECQLSTTLGWLVYPPISIVALSNANWKTARRSTAVSRDFPYLLVEFLGRSESDTLVDSIKIYLAGKLVEARYFDKSLFMGEIGGFGVRIILQLT